jgi:hypothetical protein
VARKNVGGHEFWRKILNGAAEVAGLHEFDSNTERWNGPIFRFVWGNP